MRDYPLAGKARSRLKEACKEAYEYALKWPSVRHLIVTYVRHPDVRTSACLSLAERSGSRIHADAERARGRYLDVVTLDITRL